MAPCILSEQSTTGHCLHCTKLSLCWLVLWNNHKRTRRKEKQRQREWRDRLLTTGCFILSVSGDNNSWGGGVFVCFTVFLLNQRVEQRGCSEDNCTELAFSATLGIDWVFSYDHQCCYSEQCNNKPINGECSCLCTSTLCSYLLFSSMGAHHRRLSSCSAPWKWFELHIDSSVR